MKPNRRGATALACFSIALPVAQTCFAGAGAIDVAFGDRGMYIHGVREERSVRTRQVVVLPNGLIAAMGGTSLPATTGGASAPSASFVLTDTGQLKGAIDVRDYRTLAVRASTSGFSTSGFSFVSETDGCQSGKDCAFFNDPGPRIAYHRVVASDVFLYMNDRYAGMSTAAVDSHAGNPAILAESVVSLGLTYFTWTTPATPPELQYNVPPTLDVVVWNANARRDPALEAKFLQQIMRCNGDKPVLPNKTVPITLATPDNHVLFGLGACVLRLNADGTPDASFGANGMSTVDNAGLPIHRMLQMPDGSLLTFYLLSDSSSYRITKRLPNGQPETAFGVAGVIASLPLPFVPTRQAGGNAHGLPAVDARGRLLMAGTLAGGVTHYLGRFDSKLNPDKSFGDPATGLVALGDPSRGVFVPETVAFDAQERIVVAGQWQPDIKTAGTVVRRTSEVVTRLLPDDDATVTLVELYNAFKDHYFMTWSPAEIDRLRQSAAGWNTTGQTFRAYLGAKAGTSAVCRWYLPPGYGDSHFFGRDATECNEVAQKFPQFILEDPRYFYTVLPIAGVCPTGTQPVYRLFDSRPDANHRYTADRAVRDQMIAKGWVLEGDGPEGVAICAP